MSPISKKASTFLMAVAAAGCYPNQRIVNSSNGQWANQAANTQAAPVRRSFEQDIDAMRTANFIFIYVFRRKDGAVLDAEDKRFASQTIPQEMNRRAVSDEGKAVIIGSNFRMPAENWKLLSERFAAEDLSRPDARSPGESPPPNS